jgi:GTP cyclohydrolase I
MENLFLKLLQTIGEDPKRSELRRTPARAAEAMMELTAGLREDPKEFLQHALHPAETDGMVIVKDIEFTSLCEHHMLPFFGRVHVGYVPRKHMIGLSKITRIVEHHARRLQVQERLGQDIVEMLEKTLKPKGIAVVVEARHLCMMMRGMPKQNAVVTTSHVAGLFKKDPKTRQEFLTLIR